MTTQTPATAEIEKWLRSRVRFFPNFWLRFWIRFRKKNPESSRSRLPHSGSGPTSAIHMLHEQPEMEWARRVISIVACWHSVKLCELVTRLSNYKEVLWPRCEREGGAMCNLHKKNLRSVRFIPKRRGCCCNLSVGVALKMRFTTNCGVRTISRGQLPRFPVWRVCSTRHIQ